MPYLPIDPADLGRSYEAVIRVNSQSGKGGVAWVLEQDKGLKLPKRMQADFSRHVQALADETSRELNAADIWRLFERDLSAAATATASSCVDYEESGAPAATALFVGRVAVDGEERSISGRGNGLISGVIAALARRARRRRSTSSIIASTRSATAPTRRRRPMSNAAPPTGAPCSASASTPTSRPPRVRAVLSAANRA